MGHADLESTVTGEPSESCTSLSGVADTMAVWKRNVPTILRSLLPFFERVSVISTANKGRSLSMSPLSVNQT
jgi:hypothetical protein